MMADRPHLKTHFDLARSADKETLELIDNMIKKMAAGSDETA